MKTCVFSPAEDLTGAAEAVKNGGLVAVPTETVYGLCCDGLNEEAVRHLYEVKGRPENKPLALMVPGKEAMELYCREVPPQALRLADAFWPGPLTIILPARGEISPTVLAGGDTVGLRCPNHPLTLALLQECGRPLAGPSANPSGAEPAKDARAVLEYFDGRIEAVLDGGECAEGTPSTIVSLCSLPYRILRQGPLTAEDIAGVLRQGVTLVGITGGTGCGKTTALRVLEEKGALLLDCDAVYHEFLESSGELLQELRERFGDGVFTDGRLNRKALGAVVFADEAALKDLNAITHRYVTDELERRILDFAMSGGTLAAIDAIALVESGLAERCSISLGVLAPKEMRIRRIMARDGITEEYARLRVEAQHGDEFFRENCSHVIVNDGTAAEFEAKCRTFFEDNLKNI